jgi:hypothetical protein
VPTQKLKNTRHQEKAFVKSLMLIEPIFWLADIYITEIAKIFHSHKVQRKRIRSNESPRVQ